MVLCKHHIRCLIGILFLWGCSLVAFAQPEEAEAPELDLGINKDDGEETLRERRLNKKKKKKNVFYGQKTRRRFITSGVGMRQITERLRFLKNYRDPDPYVRYFYWYNPDLGKIEKANNARRERELEKLHKANGKILHGPYQKKQDGVVIEQGFFYFGTKHGRWEEFKKEQLLTFKDTIEIEQQILLGKEVYHKGWPRSTKFTYHDPEKKLIKEVYPYDRDGVLNGDYYKFYKNTKLAGTGQYMEGEKVGVWEERYDNARNTVKKQIEYPADPSVEDREPVLLKELAEDGRITGGEGEDEVFDPIKKRLRRR